MQNLPKPVQNLVDAFSRLPGIGPKTASRLTFFLLRAPEDISQSLADALKGIKENTRLCEVCFNITNKDTHICEICASETRDRDVLCVVEEPLDVLAIEKTSCPAWRALPHRGDRPRRYQNQRAIRKDQE